MTTPSVLPDQMAAMWVLLPAVDATLVHKTLDRAARTEKTAGDPRTLSQLRADLLCAWVCEGTTDGQPGSTDPPNRAGRADWEGPADPADPADPAGRADPADRRDRAGDLAGVLSPGAVRSVPRGRCRPRVDVRVTVADSTLMGLDDLPAHLEEYGPITAAQARALALGGVWRRLVTDPHSGTVLDVGRTRYRPPPDMAEHVRERDRQCARPGCTAPARTTDLDHTDEFDPSTPDTPGGSTSADNLGPLCRRCHLLKTHAGHHLTQPAPGNYTWTTPTGHRHTSTPGHSGTNDHLGPPSTTPTQTAHTPKEEQPTRHGTAGPTTHAPQNRLTRPDATGLATHNPQNRLTRLGGRHTAPGRTFGDGTRGRDGWNRSPHTPTPTPARSPSDDKDEIPF